MTTINTVGQIQLDIQDINKRGHYEKPIHILNVSIFLDKEFEQETIIDKTLEIPNTLNSLENCVLIVFKDIEVKNLLQLSIKETKLQDIGSTVLLDNASKAYTILENLLIEEKQKDTSVIVYGYTDITKKDKIKEINIPVNLFISNIHKVSLVFYFRNVVATKIQINTIPVEIKSVRQIQLDIKHVANRKKGEYDPIHFIHNYVFERKDLEKDFNDNNDVTFKKTIKIPNTLNSIGKAVIMFFIEIPFPNSLEISKDITDETTDRDSTDNNVILHRLQQMEVEILLAAVAKSNTNIKVYGYTDIIDDKSNVTVDIPTDVLNDDNTSKSVSLVIYFRNVNASSIKMRSIKSTKSTTKILKTFTKIGSFFGSNYLWLIVFVLIIVIFVWQLFF